MSKLLAAFIIAFGMAGTAHALTILHHHGGNPGATPAPEIDPAAAMAALTLLGGGLAVLRGRRKK